MKLFYHKHNKGKRQESLSNTLTLHVASENAHITLLLEFIENPTSPQNIQTWIQKSG